MKVNKTVGKVEKFIYRQFLIHSRDILSLVIPINKTIEHWRLEVCLLQCCDEFRWFKFVLLISNEIVNFINTMSCPIKVNRNTIKLTMHTSCYWVLDLLCVIGRISCSTYGSIYKNITGFCIPNWRQAWWIWSKPALNGF